MIEILVADLRPLGVENRARAWRLVIFSVAPVMLLLLLFLSPFRADFASHMADGFFVSSVATSALVFLAGVLTLSVLRVPRRSRLWLLLPVVAFGFWLASEFAGIAAEFYREGMLAFAFASSPECPLVITVVGGALLVAMLGFAREAVLLWRGPAVAIAALSAFSLPAAFLNLFHDLDTAAMVLLWHFGAIAVLSAAAVLVFHRWIPGFQEGLGL
ncbi:NrsF family protein [Inquilinus sp. OTU3971]|uniref:NrsF family protein n=1 Tax=Inquilinus sp. OTU3971 TaxID=3043855 RepID=UPI00313CD737